MNSIIKRSIPALLLLLMLVAACSEQSGMDIPAEKGRVPVVVKMPGVYTPLPATRANPHPDLNDVDTLPDGSTLRLVIIKPEAVARILDKKVICLEDVEPACIRYDADNKPYDIGYTYVLQNTNNEITGPQHTIPCTLTYDDLDNDNDNDITEVTSIQQELFPYTIPVTGVEHDYYCVAISPAKRLIPEKDDVTGMDNVLKLTVRNQETLLCNNNNWEQTKLSYFTVPASVSQQAVISLNHMMHTTARIKIRVRGSGHISAMQPGNPLFEIDRIPTEPGDSWLVDKEDDKNTDGNTATQDKFTNPLLNLRIGDDIEYQMGNNILYNRMYVSQDRATVDSLDLPEGTRPEDVHVPYIPEIIAETTVLPMDARPTPMIIRLNLYVNNVPMQFQYETARKFEPGHSYNYTATVSLRANEVYIATWEDVAWGTEVYPE